MNRIIKKILHPREYYKEINGYDKLNHELREKLEYYDEKFSDSDFDKFFSWDEFKEIIRYVHLLLEFHYNGFDIFILNNGNQYCYWIEYFGEKIEDKTSTNVYEMLNEINVEGIPMLELWGKLK